MHPSQGNKHGNTWRKNNHLTLMKCDKNSKNNFEEIDTENISGIEESTKPLEEEIKEALEK